MLVYLCISVAAVHVGTLGGSGKRKQKQKNLNPTSDCLKFYQKILTHNGLFVLRLPFEKLLVPLFLAWKCQRWNYGCSSLCSYNVYMFDHIYCLHIMWWRLFTIIFTIFWNRSFLNYFFLQIITLKIWREKLICSLFSWVKKMKNMHIKF